MKNKKIVSLLLAFVMVLNMVVECAIPAFAADTEGETIDYHYVADDEITNEQRFEAYATQLFYGNSVSMFGRAARERLTTDEKVLYDALVPSIKQIAIGQRSSAMISVGQQFSDGENIILPDAEIVIPEITEDVIFTVIDALLSDMPYEMYWYDKVTGCSIYSIGTNGMDQLVFAFTVAEKYRGDDNYSANAAITGAATTAVANAQAIIDKYASATDYEKLVGYKDEICALVSYNHDAADSGDFTTDSDPWQLIYVFDGNTGTNVVCEGYSKAFMYLCDMTNFAGNVTCYTVSGDMNGGAHMWNIVTIGGNNYLIDVTNSDENTVGSDGSLFMVGAEGSITDGYTAGTIVYDYDSDTLNLWGTGEDSILKIESTDFDPNTELPEEDGIVAQGVCGDNLTWVLTDNGTLTISGSGMMYDYECTDTSHPNIFGWSHPWFDVKENITSVVIENGVTSIGNCAFAQCFNLETVEFSDDLVSIGREAFYECPLSKVDIDTTNITIINNSAFQGCSLTEIYLPCSLSVIDSYSFYNCKNLDKIVFNGDAPNIYDSAFFSVESTVYYPGNNETWTKDTIESYNLNMLWINSLTGEEFSTTSEPDSDTGEGSEGSGSGSGSGEGTGEGSGSGSGSGEGTGEGSGSGSGSGEGTGEGSGSDNNPDSPADELLNGSCGINAVWSFDSDTGTLTVSGIGEMEDYDDFVSNRPYHHFTEDIKSVIIEEGITRIGYGAFSGCHNLKSVLLNNGLKSIGGHAFATTAITDLTIPDSVVSIEMGAFSYSALNRIQLSKSLELIDDGAFSNCYNLTAINFPESLKEIGERAFQLCYELNNITFEGGAPTIERGAFSDVNADCYYPVIYDSWNSGTLLKYDGDLTWYAYDENGNIVDNDTDTDAPAYSGICGDNLQWTLKNGILTIQGTGPMYNYNYIGTLTPWYNYSELIKTVIVKEGVTSIGSFAFYDCKHFTEIQLPETLLYILEGAFYDCENLENISIPQSVTTVGAKAFRNCAKIESLSFSDNLTFIGEEAFYRCHNLSVSVHTDNAYYYVGEFGELIGNEEKELIFYPFKNANKEYQVPNGIKIIGASVFNLNKVLSHIYLPEGLEKIKSESFSNVIYLEDLSIPDSVMVIEGSAFYDSRSITQITLPKTMDSIGLGAFEYCTGITEITIPTGITYIEDGMFTSCTQLQELILPDTITEIGEEVIIGCRLLERIIFTGDAPSFSNNSFYCPGSSIVKGYYPADNSSWTTAIMQSYGGNIEWIPYSNYDNIPDSHMHNFDISVIPSTCLSAGYILKSCNCGYSVSDVSFNVGDHKEIYTPGKAPTCTEVGWTEGTLCEYCNRLFTSELIFELGHTGGAEATCTEPQECIRCGFTVTLPYGHNYAASVIKNARCTEYGIKRYECTRCGNYYDEEFDGYPGVTEHNLSITPEVAPTCIHSGMTEVSYCIRCGLIISTGESIPALGHNVITIPAKAPTCTEVGYSEEQYCSRCNEVYKSPLVFEPDGHRFGDYILNADGTKTRICSVCGEKETVTEPVLTPPPTPEPTPTPTPEPTPVVPVEDEAVRIKGKTRYETSIAIANETKAKMGVDKFNTIIIASGTNFADALAGSYLAAVKNAPILMASGTNDAQLKQYISTNLASGGQIYILGGTAAVPQTTENALSGYNVKRLKGKTRYDTNIEILKEAGVTNQDILVATGTNFADSLSASAVGKPILLVDGKGSLSQAQKNYLNSLSTDNLYILGGTGAVGANYESELAKYGKVERIKGASRHETSVEIAKKFFTNPQTAVVADAWNFPDGLCGGPLANTMNAPLILTKSGSYSAAKGYMQANGINSGAVLGGTARIDDASAKAIFGVNEIIVK